jgi:hypothetical protein
VVEDMRKYLPNAGQFEYTQKNLGGNHSTTAAVGGIIYLNNAYMYNNQKCLVSSQRSPSASVFM